MSEAFVYDAVRTVFGKLGGGLAAVRADDLGAAVIRGLLGRFPGLDAERIDEVVFGNANGAGEENRNVARMAALLAGLPVTVPGVTVNRLCGSSLDAAIIASRQIEVGDADIVLVGGVESMSRAPWVVPKPVSGYPAGDLAMISTTLGWRLVNPKMPAEWTVSLGEANEQLAEREGVSRRRQDKFAALSHTRAEQAWTDGFYDRLLVAVPDVTLTRDETIRPGTSTNTLAGLRTAFRPVDKGGTITAGNASSLNDGGSALMLGNAPAAHHLGKDPLARIAGRGTHGNDPRDFGAAPIEAANKALKRAGIGWADVDAVELNEAFAAQSLVCIDAWKVDPAIVNAKGGAIAIGHPLGASGGRVLGTVTHRLAQTGGRWGVAALCIGVGQALAVVVENVATKNVVVPTAE